MGLMLGEQGATLGRRGENTERSRFDSLKGRVCQVPAESANWNDLELKNGCETIKSQEMMDEPAGKLP